MARRGENIYHRKDGRWEGRYIIARKPDGRPKFHSIYGKTYNEVKRNLVILKSRCLEEAGENPVRIYGNGSLSEWMDYWLEVLEKPYVKETTYQLYRRNIENHLRPSIGRYSLSKLRKEEIQRMIDLLREKLSPSTLHGVCRQLKSILSAAVKNALIHQSPYQEVRLPKFCQRKPRILNEGEQKRLEQAALRSGSLEYLICLYTGIRLGELCALSYADFDFDTSYLRISRSVKRIKTEKDSQQATALVLGSPKTESSIREIPIPFFLSHLVFDQMISKQASQKDFVFCSTQGTAADPRTVQKRFSQLMKKLDICGAHMHTLRHTFAMRSLERGVRYKALAEILGHSSSAITIKCYDNCTVESKQKAMQSVQMMV